MRFLKALFLLALALALAAFAMANWQLVTVRLWPPYELVIRLPVLLFAVLLLGALPWALAHAMSRWHWRRRLARAERQLAATQPAEPSAPAAGIEPPQAQPMIVPPAGA